MPQAPRDVVDPHGLRERICHCFLGWAARPQR
jgi:hypothetical protein